MRSRMLIFLMMILTSGFSYAQSGDLTIDLNGTSSITFCKDSLQFGAMVKVEGDSIYDGLKISIANYNVGAESLKSENLSSSLSQTWLTTTGTLELRGAATAQEYQDAIENIWYYNLTPVPDTTTRQIAISLIDADFLPETGHFYRYYEQDLITWTAARDSAALKNYRGLQGYLATILSEEENKFIGLKTKGVGWIGASDAAQEGKWKWVTGPEAGTLFWTGTSDGGYKEPGAYAPWGNGEPNNVLKPNGDDEDYAHVTQDPDQPAYSWNDLSNTGDIYYDTNPNYYLPRGYLVEYGGMSSDPVLQLSTAFDIKIRKVIFGATADQTICRYDSVQLNQQAFKGDYNWSPVEGVSDVSSSMPYASPFDSTLYKALVNYDGCIDSATYQVNVIPVYTTNISIDSTQCSGYNLTVNYEGDATADADFSWYFADTLYTGGKGLTDLNIQLGFQQTNQRNLGLQISENGCQSKLSWTPIRVIPNLEITADVTEGCMPLTVNFTAQTTEDIDTYTWEFGDGLGLSTPDPTIQYTYSYAGTYDVTLTVLSTDGCTNSGTMEDYITVHPIRTVYTDIDPKFCYPHEFDVNYIGSGTDKDSYYWDLSDLDAEEIVYDPGTMLGPVRISLKNKPQATIGLQVISEFGCESAKKEFTVKRQPWFELTADALGGCSPFTATLSAAVSDPIDQLQYTWDTGLNTENGQQVSEEYSEQGAQYQVSAIGISSLTGCADTVLMDDLIEVYSDPVAEFVVDKSDKTISDPVFQFTNQTTGGVSYEWDFGDGQTSTLENPENRYQDFGWFTVYLLAESEFGCTDTVSHQVLVAPDDLFAPNALNPNSVNPDNRVFLLANEAVKADGYQMLIYNRWGEQVFETTDVTVGWDGKMKNGNYAPAGTYIWILSFLDILDKPHKQQGTVTLVF
ncbi:PKD domain-containing protein [Mangrovibacterium diazotrophicum]|uniref:PKD domain-containing protein n=1 Tax=Mangrovibacterium diazotrophicum TaxID=1261403 RepID=A0A419VZG3_9BACT|nr:PKD domain-containing protein [Mangrovibacterium diazotrophicum]RKD88450.1 PKD domain-containing protein [Mangrovibacterium diazotrophicum]